MGTSLGNLQVLNATQEQVSALMPGAVVGRWSERFVTVLDDTFGLGSVDSPARALSKQLPQAAVLSVGLVDSDLLELAVWQGGKRLTVRAHLPYDGVSKRGDPRKFCQALGLPPEDEKRLKAVWAKGDAEEQLELTAALVGAPLWSGTDALPRGEEVRDAARVDRWLAQRPDPPKVKNRTRAQVIQELAGFCPELYSALETNSRTFLFHQACVGGGFRQEEDRVFHAGADGLLEEWPEWGADIHKYVEDFASHGMHTDVKVLERGGRSLCVMGGFLLDRDDWGEGYFSPGSSVVARDAWETLPRPMVFTLDGKACGLVDFWPLDDGGAVVVLEQDMGIREGRELVRCAPDGAILWRRGLSEAQKQEHFSLAHGGLFWLEAGEQFIGLDLDGRESVRFPRAKGNIKLVELLNCQDGPEELWAVNWWHDWEARRSGYELLRLDQTGVLLQKAPLPAYLSNGVGGLAFLRDRILFLSYNEGLWLLDRADLSVKAGIADHRAYIEAVADGAGRLWVQVGGSTMEAYDQNLNLLSRHRLKGEVFSRYLDGQGRLCAVTYSECKGKHDVAFDSEGNMYTPGYDKNKEIVRVWRLA